jgi:hypothetical protein
MTMITLQLSDQTMQQAQQAAATLRRPVEEVLSEMLSAILPSVQDAPATLQSELMRMTWLDNDELWQMARGQMAGSAQEQMQQLSQLQGERPLTTEEEQQLDALRQEYGRITLIKARAYALLSLRGGKPLLSNT